MTCPSWLTARYGQRHRPATHVGLVHARTVSGRVPKRTSGLGGQWSHHGGAVRSGTPKAPTEVLRRSPELAASKVPPVGNCA